MIPCAETGGRSHLYAYTYSYLNYFRPQWHRRGSQPTMQPTIVMTYASLEGFTQPSATCKLLNVLESHRLKRLASAVQLRPWPPYLSMV